MKKKDIPYQFTAMPLNLAACMDVNCRSMLFTLLQLSSYYADEGGWFYRTNMDLQMQSRLSDKLVTEVISKFHRIGILEVQSVGQSKGKFPNRFRLNQSKFLDWEKQRLEDCLKNPNLYIEKEDRKQKGWKPSYLTSNSNSGRGTNSCLEVSRNPHNIENAENGDNSDNADNTAKEEKKKENIDTNQGTLEGVVVETDDEATARFWRNVDYLLSQIQHASHWNKWDVILMDLDQWIMSAPTEQTANEALCKLAPILREEIAWYKQKYRVNPEWDNEDDSDGFDSQLREWKGYAREGLRAGAFSYFGDE